MLGLQFWVNYTIGSPQHFVGVSPFCILLYILTSIVLSCKMCRLSWLRYPILLGMLDICIVSIPHLCIGCEALLGGMYQQVLEKNLLERLMRTEEANWFIIVGLWTSAYKACHDFLSVFGALRFKASHLFMIYRDHSRKLSSHCEVHLFKSHIALTSLPW